MDHKNADWTIWLRQQRHRAIDNLLLIILIIGALGVVHSFWSFLGRPPGAVTNFPFYATAYLIILATYLFRRWGDTPRVLVVLGLIDVVMISNLLIMVIVGGYETFVSRLNLEGHPDQPEWLSHVNASVLKVKLATAIIGISSIHLLKTFINR